MSHFLLAACCLHIIAILCVGLPWPQISTIFWKLGNLMIAAYAGYLTDKALFRDTLHDKSLPMIMMRRAVVVVGTMIAVSMGM